MEIKESTTENKETRGLPLWVVITAFTVLFGFLILIAWGLRNAQKGPITIGQKVPFFELTTFDGDVLSTEDYAGQVIVVNFWASWCGPCEMEAAEFEEAWKLYKDTGNVMFLGVDYVDTEPEAMVYLNKFNITYPNGPDLRTSISQMFRILGVPETYIIDREGHLAYVKKGPFLSLLEITNAIDGVLYSE